MDTTMQFFKPDDELNNLIHFATENYKRAVKESPNVLLASCSQLCLEQSSR